MAIKVYVVNGFGGSGKDSFENMVMSSTNGGAKTSMVELVKSYATQMGWEGGKEDKDRKFLADLKDALSQWNDIPMQYVYERIKLYETLGYNYIFVDAREKEDIERIKKDCKENGRYCRSILVDREIFKEFENRADDNVMNQKYDMTILNTGSLSDLEKCAVGFIKAEGL